jgi:hypothetical protein
MTQMVECLHRKLEALKQGRGKLKACEFCHNKIKRHSQMLCLQS